MLKSWLHYVFLQGDVNELLTGANLKLPRGGRDLYSHSTSPVSFGTSKFYDDFSSESDSAGTPSITSSIASSPNFSTMEDLTATGTDASPLDRRATVGGDTQSIAPSMLSYRKASQAFDTISITSDVFSNTSNLRNVAARYCLRIIKQSERIPQKDSDRSMITAGVVEAIEILDMLCKEDSNATQKIFVEIKRLYKRIEEKPVATRRVLVALVQFYINHHENMAVHIEDVLEKYFGQIPSYCYSNQSAAFELLELCLRNAKFFKAKNYTMVKYFPNIFKFIAWWPCTIFEEASELMAIIVNKDTAAELLHLILDLPCLCAILQLEHKGLLKNDDKLESVLRTSVRPYYKAMFDFMLRARSGGAETIDKLSELHGVLSMYGDNALIAYVIDIIPSMLLSYFSAIDDLEDVEVYRKIFPILVERIFQLYPAGKQQEVLEICANEIQFITKAFPDVVGLHIEEIMTFVVHVQDRTPTIPMVITNVLHSIGDGVAYIPQARMKVLYKTLETLVYESAHHFTAKEPEIVQDLEVLQSIISTIAKLAAHDQALLPRAILCLNKIATLNLPVFLVEKAVEFSNVKLYTHELVNVLKKPQVAPSILSDTNRLIPWHFDADNSVMTKVHVLSQQVEVL